MLKQAINKLTRAKETTDDTIYMDIDEFLKGQNIDTNIINDDTRKDDDNE